MQKSSIWFVIPAWNEGPRIATVLEGLTKAGHKNIVVVDDGSQDNTKEVASRYTKHVITHLVNRGPGAATKTGLDYALAQNADVIITLDADGQHSVDDVPVVLQPIMDGTADVSIGSRLINPEGMPWIRRIGNRGLNMVTFLFFGQWVSDSQSGFKAFTADALRKIELKLDWYEFCSEVIHEIHRNKLRVVEVPIKVIYTKESYAKGQSILGGFKTAWGMLKRKLLA